MDKNIKSEPLKNKKLFAEDYAEEVNIGILYKEENIKSAVKWLKGQCGRRNIGRLVDIQKLWKTIDEAFEDVTK